MKITERRLRKIIRSVIKEVRATEDEELLKINPLKKDYGPDPSEMDIADLVAFESFYPHTYGNVLTIDSTNRIVQLFKAWCNKNDVGGKGPHEILNLFYEDYPELKKVIIEDHNTRHRELKGVIKLKEYPSADDQMFDHAKSCGQLKFSNKDQF